jgi:hypothetical protein
VRRVLNLINSHFSTAIGNVVVDMFKPQDSFLCIVLRNEPGSLPQYANTQPTEPLRQHVGEHFNHLDEVAARDLEK